MSQFRSSKLSRQMPSFPASTMTTVIVAVVVIAALYFGREVLVPIALALILSFILAPLVRFLQRFYVPRIAAVLVVVLLAFSTILGLGAAASAGGRPTCPFWSHCSPTR
jgi:predicted PurR-regulated permease PerM